MRSSSSSWKICRAHILPPRHRVSAGPPAHAIPRNAI
jgi:hypothetical protein